MHRAVSRCRAGLRLHAIAAGHDPGFPRGRTGAGLSLCRAVLESASAQAAAQAGRLDGEIQKRHGLSHAGHRRLADVGFFQQGGRRALARAFPGGAGAGGLDLGPIRATRRATPGAGGGDLPAAARRRITGHPGRAASMAFAPQTKTAGIDWKTWSAEAVEEARRAGHPVLVDFTAKSCLTCKLNLASSLEIDRTRAKLRQIGAVAFKADDTREDPAIGRELRRFNTSGVPLVLVYSKDLGKEPQVLPTFLTPAIVLNALDQAAK